MATMKPGCAVRLCLRLVAEVVKPQRERACASVYMQPPLNASMPDLSQSNWHFANPSDTTTSLSL